MTVRIVMIILRWCRRFVNVALALLRICFMLCLVLCAMVTDATIDILLVFFDSSVVRWLHIRRPLVCMGVGVSMFCCVLDTLCDLHAGCLHVAPVTQGAGGLTGLTEVPLHGASSANLMVVSVHSLCIAMRAVAILLGRFLGVVSSALAR
jgi:hypothetical protein